MHVLKTMADDFHSILNACGDTKLLESKLRFVSGRLYGLLSISVVTWEFVESFCAFLRADSSGWCE